MKSSDSSNPTVKSPARVGRSLLAGLILWSLPLLGQSGYEHVIHDASGGGRITGGGYASLSIIGTGFGNQVSTSYRSNSGPGPKLFDRLGLSIGPANTKLVAVDDEYALDEGGVLNGNSVLANDISLDELPLVAILAIGPEHGELNLSSDGTFEYVHDGSETLIDRFTYAASDGESASAPATVVLTITPINDAPVALGDDYELERGGTLAGSSVLANDTDAEEVVLIAILVTAPDHGALTLNPDGTFEYVHDGSETFADAFTYRANDGELDSEVVEVAFTITFENDAPEALSDQYALEEGATLLGASVLLNDTDAQGTPLVAFQRSVPEHGELLLNPNGNFQYIHDGSESFIDGFSYVANDGILDSAIANVLFTITPINDAPMAVADAYLLEEGVTLIGSSLLTNDFDAEGTPLVASLVTAPEHGQLTLNPDGTFEYIHDGSEILVDGFIYVANDGELDSEPTQVTLNNTPVNDAPVGIEDEFVVEEGATFVGSSVLANDTDAEGTPLLAVLGTGPEHGVLTLDPDGTFEYIHDGSETLSDTFTYKANDGELDSEIVEVVLTITPVNDAPVALGDGYELEEGATLAGSSVLVNDADAEESALTAALVTGPEHGELTLNPNGTFEYVHDGSETVSDTFTYKANDGELDSEIVDVVLTITPVNDAPVALGDEYELEEGATLAGSSVLANDSDAEGSVLIVSLVTDSAHGELTLNPDGTFEYVHDGSETLSDTFTCQVNDGELDSEIVDVVLTITPVNDAPVALGDEYELEEGATLAGSSVLVNDSDAEESALTAALVTGPEHGELTLNPDGTFEYVHDESETLSDTFTYKVNDGELDSEIVDVVLTITPVNDAPVALGDEYELEEGATLAGSSVLVNDSDAEESALTASLVSSSEHGELTLNPDGTFEYVHDGSETFSDAFTYQANDGELDSEIVEVVLTITSVNDAPVALGDEYELEEGATLAGSSVLANDSDAEESTLTAALVTGSEHGELTLNADGTFEYVHDGSETVSDTFTYKANDGELDSEIVEVVLTITPVNDAPVALDDEYVLVAGERLEGGSVLANDLDAEESSLIAVLVTSPEHGELTLSPTGVFTYIPHGGEALLDGFSYVANDGDLHSEVAFVSILINPFHSILIDALVGSEGVDTGKGVVVNGSLLSQEKIEIGQSGQVSGDLRNVEGEIKLKSNSVVMGEVVAGGQVNLENQSRAASDVNSGGDVRLKNRAEVSGDVIASGSVTVANNASVDGDISENAPAPNLPSLRLPDLEIEAGGENVEVARNETLVLAPGVYGDLKLRQNAVLKLTSGAYYFSAIDGGKGATLEMNLISGAIHIHVVEELELDQGSEMRGFSPEGGDPAAEILIQVQGTKVKLGQNGHYLGTIMAPNADIHMDKGAELTGALFGKRIFLGSQVKIHVQAALELLMAASETWAVKRDDSKGRQSLRSLSTDIEPSIRFLRADVSSAAWQALDRSSITSVETVHENRSAAYDEGESIGAFEGRPLTTLSQEELNVIRCVVVVEGAPNRRFQLQRSDNLSSWRDWGAVTTDQYGYAIIPEATAVTQANHFYKIETRMGTPPESDPIR